jgi:flagella basal body P-ring formation protein FlgA
MVSALATTAADADVGDSVLVTVADSGKVLRGRVQSSNVVTEAK